MLGFSHLSVLYVNFQQSQPVGYMHHVSCFYDVCHVAFIVYFSCTLPLLAYFISRM